jgi:hypothetical protein
MSPKEEKTVQLTGELTVSTNEGPTQPPPEAPDLGWERLRFWVPRIWVGFLSILVVIAGGLLVFGGWPGDGAEPRDVLLFAVVAAAIAILPNLKTFKFGDVSMELRALSRKVAGVEKSTAGLTGIDERLADVEGRLAEIEGRLAKIEGDLEEALPQPGASQKGPSGG